MSEWEDMEYVSWSNGCYEDIGVLQVRREGEYIDFRLVETDEESDPTEEVVIAGYMCKAQIRHLVRMLTELCEESEEE